MANPGDTRHDQGIFPLIFFEADLVTIHTGTNDTLQVVEDTGGAGTGPNDIDVTVPTNSLPATNTSIYSCEQLAGLLADLLTAESIVSGDSLTYIVTYDMTTHKFTITTDGGVILNSIDVSDSTICFTSAGRQLGFSSDPAGATSITSNVVVDVNNTANSISSNLLYFASETITAGSDNDFAESYQDLTVQIGGMGNIRNSIPADGGMATTNSLTLTLLNQEEYSDLIYSMESLDNVPMNVYTVFNDGTDLVYSEKCMIMSGVIDDYDWNENGLTMILQDNVQRLEAVLPKDKVVLSDTTAFPNPDMATIDRPINIIYGDFDTANSTAGVERVIPANFDLAPSTGRIDYVENEYLIASHEMNKLGADDDTYFLYVGGLDVYISLKRKSGAFGVNNTATKASVDLPELIESRVRARCLLRDPQDTSGLDFSAIVDNDRTNTMDIPANKNLYMRFPEASSPGGSKLLSRLSTQVQIEVDAYDDNAGAGRTDVYVVDITSGKSATMGPLVGVGTNTFTIPLTHWDGTWENLMHIGYGIETDAGMVNLDIEGIFADIRYMTIFDTGIRLKTETADGPAEKAPRRKRENLGISGGQADPTRRK